MSHDIQYPQFLYQFRATNKVTGRRYTTRYHLTDQDAAERLIDPVRIDTTRQVVEGPGGYTSDFLRGVSWRHSE
ncbi:hypothetical protein GCM10007907_16760 [Chitinimonas prasina]|uniref:Uncharacterized protein n=1 Tax=Chitinimonas prasina TaxID=1434937 RepID=A0ABQ5YHY1_9NEIS|nr:hypothetical protein GCM10007907_16760 [Chitinimonas prasina]